MSIEARKGYKKMCRERKENQGITQRRRENTYRIQAHNTPALLLPFFFSLRHQPLLILYWYFIYTYTQQILLFQIIWVEFITNISELYMQSISDEEYNEMKRCPFLYSTCKFTFFSHVIVKISALAAIVQAILSWKVGALLLLLLLLLLLSDSMFVTWPTSFDFIG